MEMRITRMPLTKITHGSYLSYLRLARESKPALATTQIILNRTSKKLQDLSRDGQLIIRGCNRQETYLLQFSGSIGMIRGQKHFQIVLEMPRSIILATRNTKK